MRDLETIADTLFANCKEVLVRKNDEYTINKDVLHNVYQAASLQGLTLTQLVTALMSKHTVAIFNMVTSKNAFSEEVWDEKIIDQINYLILLKIALEEDDLIKQETSSSSEEDVILGLKKVWKELD